jgi:hypothetical protein
MPLSASGGLARARTVHPARLEFATTAELTREIFRLAKPAVAREEIELTVFAVGSRDLALSPVDVDALASSRGFDGGCLDPRWAGADLSRDRRPNDISIPNV